MTIAHDGRTLPRRRPGPKPRGRTVIPLTITVTHAQRTALEALADAEKSSISLVVRRFIAAGLATVVLCILTAFIEIASAPRRRGRPSGSKGVSMDAQTLKGMAIVSVTEGTKLGSVAQPLLDLTARRVAALRVAGDAGTFILPFERIARIGADAVTVESSAATQTPSTGGAADGLVDLHALGKLKVVDSEGTLLGTVSRVEFDPVSGEITQLAAHKGGMLGIGGTTTPIDARAIVQVGPALLTVNTEATIPAAAPSAP